MQSNCTVPPLLAIKCLVYNHEPYLRQCLDGFVMQQTNFPFIAIVHDDASTDNSAAIIREYEEKYPDIIKTIYETENQYSKSDGSLTRIMNKAIDELGCKYVAVCEGDDYWTDPQKLQKQVDFLEAHEDFSVCCHNVNMWDESTHTMTMNYATPNAPEEASVVELAKANYIINLSVMYRYNPQVYTNPFPDTYAGDYPMHLRHAEYGKIKYFPQVMGVYRAGSGVWSTLSAAEMLQKEIQMVIELQKYYKDRNDIFESLCFQLNLRLSQLLQQFMPKETPSLLRRWQSKVKNVLKKLIQKFYCNIMKH